ncbi:hypothetical protein FACS1894219_05010 [Clostridia bacterium]|nr:hypothetical protein FACS1894219_05010 [Clostridia bacterium]
MSIFDKKDKSGKSEKKLAGKSDKIADLLSFPEGSFRDFPTIQIRGNRNIWVDGCASLLSYSTENIILDTKYTKISVAGTNLTLHSLSGGVLAVKGYISGVEFKM